MCAEEKQREREGEGGDSKTTESNEIIELGEREKERKRERERERERELYSASFDRPIFMGVTNRLLIVKNCIFLLPLLLGRLDQTLLFIVKFISQEVVHWGERTRVK